MSHSPHPGKIQMGHDKVLVVMEDILEQGRKRPHERKGLKYQDLAQDCTEKGWQTWIRVSLTTIFRNLYGQCALVLGKDLKAAVCRIGEAAERALMALEQKGEEGLEG